MSRSELVLVAEDEKELNTMIRDYLSTMGYSVVQAYDGKAAIDLFQKEQPDLIVIDIMMPGIDGIDVTRRIRETSQVPIIMLTARTTENDKVLGLDIGADDYVTKPFSLKELAARIRAVLRRKGKKAQSTVYEHRELFLDVSKRLVTINGTPAPLTSVQFSILQKLIEEPERVFTRMDLLKSFQDVAFEGYERTIDVHIKNIRKAIEENPSQPEYVQTVWGVGYKLA